MNHRIGDFIKEKLEEKQISMRALSKKQILIYLLYHALLTTNAS